MTVKMGHLLLQVWQVFWYRKESVSGAQVAQLNEFLDELPEVPRDKVCVDDSDGYQAPGKKNHPEGKLPPMSLALIAP